MIQVSIQRHVDAPIEQVYRLGTAIERWPEWLESLLEVTNLSGPGTEVGTEADLALKGPDRVHHLHLRITRTEPFHLHIHEASEPGGMSYTSTIRLMPADGGTDFTWEQEIEPAPGLLGALAGRFFLKGYNERQLRQSCDAFEKLIAREKTAVPV